MPAAGKDWVLRVPRSESASEFVLIYVSPTGKAALDLRFTATEGENPYVGVLRQSRLKGVRPKNFQGSDQELEQILQHALRVPNVSQEGIKASEIETTASIRKVKRDNHELVITIRRKIDSITQRVATLTLTQDDDQTIELFEWMGLMLERSDAYEHQISTLTSQIEAAEESIKRLQTSLADLVQSKNEHENLLLASFARVLNEKKLKIRNQQRLLATSNVASGQVRDEDSMIDQEETSSKSRRNKRKAPSRRQDKPPSDTDDEGFEKMDIDHPKPSRRKDGTSRTNKPQIPNEEEEEEEEEEDKQEENDEDISAETPPETPQPLEEETESEIEEERQASSSTPPPPAPTRSSDERQPEKSDRPDLAKAAEVPPPPRRDLPFARRDKGSDQHGKTEAKKPVTQDAEADAGEATGGETDDDEL